MPRRCRSAMISKICSTMTGARPIDGSSSSISFGSIISPRAIVSICCSPPESVPACCRSRSRRRGKRSSEVSSSSCVRALLRLRYAPIRRFSNTVFSAKMPRPSGTCAMPRAAISCGGRCVMSSPSNVIFASGPSFISPEMALSVVLLPAPFAPMSVTISPCSTFRSMPFSARIFP